MESYRLPLILNGRIVYRRKTIPLRYVWKNPVELSLPRLEDNDITKLLNAKNYLEETNTREIISFLDEVGENWKKRNYYLRTEAIELAERVTGYHKNQLELDFDLIAKSLTIKNLEATLDTELGDKSLIETWIRRGNSEVRVFPRGKVLHILAGNVPEVGILSLIRGVLSKNINILKLSSKDPISTLYFVRSFRDIDATHPITLTTSAIYWERDSPLGERLISSADAICVWGGKKALEYTRRYSKPGQVLIEFGPKKSVQLIDKETLQNRKKLWIIAKKSAHDILLHDQRACNSPFAIFVEGNASIFCEFLSEALKEENKKLPRGFLDPQLMAIISELRQLLTILGDQVTCSSYDWAIVKTNDVNRAMNFYIPSSRIIFVVGVPDLKRIIKYIDSSIMVIGFSSTERLISMRDVLSKRGVERLTEIGKMSYPQIGFTSGWVYPLSLLVKWVCRDLSQKELHKTPPPKLESRWVRF